MQVQMIYLVFMLTGVSYANVCKHLICYQAHDFFNHSNDFWVGNINHPSYYHFYYIYKIHERYSTTNRHNVCCLCLAGSRYCHRGIPDRTIAVEWPSWHHHTYIARNSFKESINKLRSVCWTVDAHTLDVWLQFHMKLPWYQGSWG